jgi:biopolymer transport protein ExbD
LPLAPAALPGSDLTFDRMSVVMDAQGRVKAGDKWLEEDDAAAWWTGQAKTRKAGLETLHDQRASDDELPTIVIVRADREASYGVVRRMLATAQEKGFAHFSLVVLRRRGR